MTRLELIKYVEEELSLSCALSINLPAKNINRIIEQSLKWFYEKYEDAVENSFYIIPAQVFSTPEFRKHRSIIFPNCTVSVHDFRESGSGSFNISGTMDKDFSGNKLIASEMSMGSMGDGLVYFTAFRAFADLAQAYTLKTVAYEFNQNTKKLTVLGRDPRTNLIALTYDKIPEDKLFDDVNFIDYVVAQSKIQLSRLLGTFQYNLPGGISINFSDIRSEGQEDLERIRQEISDSQTPDWFLTF